MRLKSVRSFGLVLLLLIIAALALWFTVPQTFSLVCDDSWNVVFPIDQTVNFYWSLMKTGTRLKIKTIKSDMLNDKNALKNSILQQGSSSMVILSPVVSAAVRAAEINVSEMLSTSFTIGIGLDNNKGFFDTVLVSQIDDGWLSSPDNSIAVYDKNCETQAKKIINTRGSITGFNKNDFGGFFATELKKRIQEQEIKQILLLSTSDINELLKNSKNTEIVVDYRYSNAIPSELLKGTIHPLLWDSIKNLIGASKTGGKDKGVLLYGYSESVGSIFRQNFSRIQRYAQKIKQSCSGCILYCIDKIRPILRIDFYASFFKNKG